MNAAIIHFEDRFSRLDQILINRTLKKVKRTIKMQEEHIPMYLLPLSKDKPSAKVMKRFITYLKEEKIKYVIFSKEALPFLELFKNHNEGIEFFSGIHVIHYKIFDILRKYADKKNIELSASTVTLITEYPEQAKEMILRIYRYVKKIRIKTKYKEKFTPFLEYFLHEYGLYIICDETEENSHKEIMFPIQYYDMNVFFKCKKEIGDISSYININQEGLEFIIYALYHSLSEENVKRFCKEYIPKISKIQNND